MLRELLFHNISEQDTLNQLGTSLDGLSEKEAKTRFSIYGPNELQVKKKQTRLILFFSQFKNAITYILLVATAISWIVGKLVNVAVILAVIGINGIIGFVQEIKADAALSALQNMSAPEADVIRNCNQATECIEMRLKASEIVPGDIILLEAGDKVPADARLLEVVNLEVDESMLTGESLPVRKQMGIFPATASLADRRNIVYAGTLITSGRGRAVVYSTGMRTEMGKIAHLIDETEDPTTLLQKRMDDLIRKLGLIAILMSVITFLIGIARGFEFVEMLLFGIATLVSSIPSGLPAAITITLAVGVQRMARRKAIIRKLAAIDSLGGVTTIVTDKTGTLTTNQMTARKVLVDHSILEITGIGYKPEGIFHPQENPQDAITTTASGQDLHSLLVTAILCNNSHLVVHEVNPGVFRWEITGDPTEGALVVAGAKLHLQKETLRKRFPRVDEIPFESKTKYMGTFNATGTSTPVPQDIVTLHLKGAPEVILNFAESIATGGKSIPLNPIEKGQVLEASNIFAGQGLRVLGFASMPLSASNISQVKTHLTDGRKSLPGLVFLGLVGMIDPPRDEVKRAIQLCKNAGIHVIMATGDHKLTAKAIGEEIGIVTPGSNLLEGVEVDSITDEQLDVQIKSTSAFVRVSPIHKFRVVNSLRRHQEIVAMTGDGANDAPALKAADVGIAMGITGTDVTKETAKMVLVDDNFASIVNAVEEGRVVADNIKKGVKFLITTNVGEILTILLSILFLTVHAPLFTALTILWVNLVTDGTLTVAIAFESKEADVMLQPPKSPSEKVLSKDLLVGVLFTAVYMAASVFIISQLHGETSSIVEKQTLAFTTLSLAQITNAVNCRSRSQSIFKLGFRSNRTFLLGMILALVLQVLAVQTPFMNLILGTTPLNIVDWVVIGASALFLLMTEELRKHILRKRQIVKKII